MENMAFLLALPAIIGFITLIVFFVMSANIGAIKNRLETMDAMLRAKMPNSSLNYIVAFDKGELKEYLGKKQEALECYMEAYYLIHKFIKKNPTATDNKAHKELIENKIKSLGGTVKEI